MSCKNKKSDFESGFLLDFFFSFIHSVFFFTVFLSLSLSPVCLSLTARCYSNKRCGAHEAPKKRTEQN